MSCDNCERAAVERDLYPYRWGRATVIVVGCREHIREIFEVLNAHQEAERDR